MRYTNTYTRCSARVLAEEVAYALVEQRELIANLLEREDEMDSYDRQCVARLQANEQHLREAASYLPAVSRKQQRAIEQDVARDYATNS